MEHRSFPVILFGPDVDFIYSQRPFLSRLSPSRTPKRTFSAHRNFRQLPVPSTHVRDRSPPDRAAATNTNLPAAKNSCHRRRQVRGAPSAEVAEADVLAVGVVPEAPALVGGVSLQNLPVSLPKISPFPQKPQPTMRSLRVSPLGTLPDSPEAHHRLISEDPSKPLVEEKTSVLIWDQTSAADPTLGTMGSGRREKFTRSYSSLKSHDDDDADLEDSKAEKDREKNLHGYKPVRIHNQALLSGLAYCISSCSMILVNKFVLSGYEFSAGISLMMYQNFVSVTVVLCLKFFGLISTEPLSWRLIRVWLPVNIIFVGMLFTSIFSLRYINVAMVTILKNVTNVITAIGETYFFQKHHGGSVWASLLLMIVSAVSGGITDVSFHAIGYTWQIINCFLTASYSLTLRKIMESAVQATKTGTLNEFSMVLLNNLLSLPLGVILVFVFNEVDYLFETPLLRMPVFWMTITLSGFLGLAISFTSMWFLHQTGATTYSLVGSLNKIPLSIAGIVLFNVPTSLQNFLSILFGLLAGVFFAKAKM